MSRQTATKAVRREDLTRFEARFRQHQAKRRAAMLAEAAAKPATTTADLLAKPQQPRHRPA
ncbi:MAG: hypothetical protein EOR22_23675 [Mesorhizobium sp.]|nr:MAG: hypothetical protein EOR22_23675 [Mesorhizobium sp.]